MLAAGDESRDDTRMTAMLSGTMRDNRSSQDVRIGDISPKGLMVVCPRPPSRGEIVDIAVSGHHLAGRVMWVNGRRFGIRVNQRIDVSAILNGRPPKKRFEGKKIADSENPDRSTKAILVGYSVLGVTAFSTAYLLVTYVIL